MIKLQVNDIFQVLSSMLLPISPAMVLWNWIVLNRIIIKIKVSSWLEENIISQRETTHSAGV